MATVSLSPTPSHISATAMSTRRLPLSSNPNAINSPLRGSSALTTHGSKRIRTLADVQREEPYGQPPPAKRQMLEHGVQRGVTGSPSRTRSVRSSTQRPVSRAVAAAAAERASQQAVARHEFSEKELDYIRQWQTQTRARFPRMVFYFESIPDEHRAKLAKQVIHFGAREEKFFSINITHVVTTRSIPPEKPIADESEHNVDAQMNHEQPRTIDPSLLNRVADVGVASSSGKRRLALDTASSRRIPIPVQAQEDVMRRPKTRSTDVLHRAREMNKKIWSLEKLQKILEMLLEPDPYRSASRSQGNAHGKPHEQSNLLQLLQNERVHGPSDRDPSVVTKELHYFKGPYIYIYDIEEKMKPIMIREYAKVADKKDGDWPQLRAVSQGRCPFVPDAEVEKENRGPSRPKERVIKAGGVEAAAPTLAAPEAPPPKPVTGKRSLAEMENGQNRGAAHSRPTRSFDAVKISNPPSLEFRAPNTAAFMSRARPGRFLAGEPVASGVQPSNVTSAIRSQMISSTTGGVLGAKAGTSKEIHGLQRKVLQKASTPTVSQQDLSSRRMGEMSHDSNTFVRSASVGRTTSHWRLDLIEEDTAAAAAVAEAAAATTKQRETIRRTASVPVTKTTEKRRELKPGYCENCQDKFDDFDDHIVSRKHRKFAENDGNWAQLDALLGQLKRMPSLARTDDDDKGSYEWEPPEAHSPLYNQPPPSIVVFLAVELPRHSRSSLHCYMD